MSGSSIASFAFRQRDLAVLGLILAVCGCLDSQQKSLQTGSDRNQAAEEDRDTVAAPPDSIPPGILEQRRFQEAPLLAEQVKSGQLPPVHLTLPEVPLVIRPIAEIGQYGGTLRRALTADIIEEDGIYKTLNDSLMTFARPLPKSIELNLAEEYRFYDDGRTMIMKIRKGTRWSDGEPLKVDDILFWYYDMTFDDNARSLALFPSEWMVDGEPIKLEKIDRYTLRFSSPKPLGRILHALRKAEKKGIIKLRVTGPERGSALYLNWDAPDPALRTAFRDRRVRIALSLAIDREEISALEGRGLMSPGGYSFAPGSRGTTRKKPIGASRYTSLTGLESSWTKLDTAIGTAMVGGNSKTVRGLSLLLTLWSPPGPFLLPTN